jgi:hypothetical protein
MHDNWNMCWIIIVRIPNIPWLKLSIGPEDMCAPFTVNEILARISANEHMRGVTGLGRNKGKKRKRNRHVKRTRENKREREGREGGEEKQTCP